MEITAKRIALLSTLPFIYFRKDKDAPITVVNKVIMFGDDISILLQDGRTVHVSREWRNEEWYISEFPDRIVVRLPEDMRLVGVFLKPVTPNLLARQRLAGIA